MLQSLEGSLESQWETAKQRCTFQPGSCLTCSSFPCRWISLEGDGHALIHASGAGSQSMGREVSPGSH